MASKASCQCQDCPSHSSAPPPYWSVNSALTQPYLTASTDRVEQILSQFNFKEWDYARTATIKRGIILETPHSDPNEKIIKLEFSYLKGSEDDQFEELTALFPSNRRGTTDLFVYNKNRCTSTKEVWPDCVQAVNEHAEKQKEYATASRDLSKKIKETIKKMVTDAGLIYNEHSADQSNYISPYKEGNHKWYRDVTRMHFDIYTLVDSPLAQKFTKLRERGYGPII